MTLAEAIESAQQWGSEFAWRLLGAALIVAGGWLLARGAARLLTRQLRNSASALRTGRFFVPPIVELAVLLTAAALALKVLGIADAVIGVVITVGLAVGLLNDVFNGFHNLLTRRFTPGDVIELKEDGLTGRVREVGLSAIVLQCADGTEAIIPSRKLFDRLVVKHSSSFRPVALSLALAPTMEIEVLEQEIRCAIASTPGVLADSPPDVWLSRVDADAVVFTARFRAAAFDGAGVTSQFLHEARKRFDARGIAIRSLAPLQHPGW